MASDNVLILNEDNFEQEVEKSSRLVVVDFWADWCGPCKMLGPIIDEIADENQEDAVIAKLNVDEERNLARKFRVMSIPSILFFKDGKEVDRMVGVQSKEDLLNKIESLS
ncbi:MAG TPA: thioredoxin [Eubacteriaceae bacterium]|nr:thioredoxin [Eubacteriaceae bacterium]